MSKTERPELAHMVGYHDLLADLGRRGCPICHGADRATWRYLDGLLWESVNDPGVRMGLRASHGYCREHSQMLLRVANARADSLGLAILAEDLLQHVIADAELEAASKVRRRSRGPIRPAAPCSACQLARRTEECYVRILAAAEDGSAPYEGIRHRGRGICVPHLTLGLQLVTDPDARGRLVAAFRHGAEELCGELAELARKHDYRFQHEGLTEGESSSWRRGVSRLVGEPKPIREPPR